jgi:hypothetical protein
MTVIAGADITTTGSQTYNDAVTLTTVTGFASTGAGAIAFNNTLDGGAAVRVNTAGATIFGGVVGGTTPLASLTTDVGGTTAINGGTVISSGPQLYGETVTLGANTTLTSTSSGIGFASTINADVAANNRTLTVTAPGGATFAGNLGNAAALADLDVNAGIISFRGAAPQTINVNAGGSNTVTFNGPVALAQNVTINTDGAVDNNVTFTSRINAETAATTGTLTVTTGTGTATFQSGIGSGVADRELGAVTLSGANVNMIGDVLVNGGGNVDLTRVTNLTFSDGAKIDTDRSGGATAAGSVLFGTTAKANPASVNATWTIDASADGGTASGNINLASVADVTPLKAFNAAGESINVAGTIQAQQVFFTANSVATSGSGVIVASKAFANSTAQADAAVTLRGLTGPGIFGTATNFLQVRAPGLFVVIPNGSNTLPVVFLGGAPNLKPVYEFTNDATKRLVLYNGVTPDTPAARAAIGSALAPLREVLSEVLLAGFAKENIRRQLIQGQVLETGLARPGIDEFTGDGVTGPASCQGSAAAAAAGNLACQ